MPDDPLHCDTCERALVTKKMLVRAVHSGCALTGEKHNVEVCPQRQTFEIDGGFLWDHMKRQAEE